MNCTDILDCGYNLTKLVGNDIIDNPVRWYANLNILMNEIVTISILIALGIILFLTVKTEEEGVRSHSRKALYAGLIVSIIGTLLFFIDVVGLTDVKLISWEQLLILYVVTGIAGFIDRLFVRY